MIRIKVMQIKRPLVAVMEIIFHHLSVIALLVPGEEKKMLLGTITHTPCLELIIGLHSLIFDQASVSSPRSAIVRYRPLSLDASTSNSSISISNT